MIAWASEQNPGGEIGHATLKNELKESPGMVYGSVLQHCHYAMGGNTHGGNSLCSSLWAGADGQGQEDAVSEPAWARETRGDLCKKNTFNSGLIKSRT